MSFTHIHLNHGGRGAVLVVVTVPRHEVPTDNVARGVEVLGKNLDLALNRLANSPRNLGRAADTALTVAQGRCLLDPAVNEAETWEAFVTAMQAASAVFVAAQTSEGEVEFRIADVMRTVPATGALSCADAGNWVNAFWLAVICRDADRLDMLSRITLDLLQASGAVYDEYVYSWVRALQISWQERSVPLDMLLAAIRGTAPETLRVASRELMLKILYPPMELLLHYTREDREQFNQSLAHALKLHKEYWTAHEERAVDPSGFVALGPLAIACLAYDAAAIPIEVESEYLPKHLLQRSWVGEFET